MWITFSILAALCWATVNTVDKYILTKWIRTPLVPVIIVGIIGLLVSMIVYFVYGFSSLSNFNIFLAFVAGIFYILMTVFYFKALKIGEVSRVVPLFYLSPLFILILAGIFLGEVFALIQYWGIFLLVLGAFLISSENPRKIRPTKAFWWMLLATLSIAVSALLTKHLLNFADYWTVFAWTRIGSIIAIIPITYLYFPELIATIKEHGKRVVTVMSANETLNILGVLFITIATSVGYVTLVNTLSSVQPFFVLVFTVILSLFYPSILKEEIGKSVISQKLLAIILMFIGAILIT